MKIIFFGTPEFALPSLQKLIEAGFAVEAIVTTPDEAVGRKGELTPPPVKVFGQEKNIEILQPTTLRDDSFFDKFKKIEPDVCVIVAYGKIIPQKYLDIPKFGFINIHPSLLPKYRGPSPIQSAILSGDQKTGVTIMRIDAEMDHGPVLANIEYQISDSKGYQEVSEDLAAAGADLLVEILPKYLSGEITPQEQDHSLATYCKKYERLDGRIDWSKSAQQIHNQIRALNPNPGTWTTLNGKTLNIFKAEISEKSGQERIIKDKTSLLIKANDRYIAPTLLQLEGKKVLAIKDFLNGLRDEELIIE